MEAMMGTAAILVAEVADPARLSVALGEMETRHALERCRHRMERAAAAFGGTVGGDGGRLIATFRSPAAAVDAAIEMLGRVEALPRVSGITLTVRVGIHPGAAGDMEASAVSARLASLAAPGQVLLSAALAGELPAAQKGKVRPREMTPSGAAGEKIFEIVRVPSAASGPAEDRGPSSSQGTATLRLRVAGSEIVLGPDRPMASLGRGSDADIVVRDPRASRSHGQIEFRDGRYVLVDRSANGTWVSFEGGTEMVLRDDEAVLHGRGRIGFGHASDGGTDDAVEFEIVG